MRCCLCFSDLHLFPRLGQLLLWMGRAAPRRPWRRRHGHSAQGLAILHWEPCFCSASCVWHRESCQHGSSAVSQAASHLRKHPVALSQLRVSLLDLYHLLCLCTPRTSRLENLPLQGYEQSQSPGWAKGWSVPGSVVNNIPRCKFLPTMFKWYLML